MNVKRLQYILILFNMLFQVFTNQIHANKYFIDYQNGNDDNNGKGIRDAFRHFPGDPNACTNAKSTQLEGGDTVVFKGDVHYVGHVIINQSGKCGNHIVLISGHLCKPEWGLSNAVVDAKEVLLSDKRNGAISLISNSYITIKGLKIINVRHTGKDSYYGAIGWKGPRGGNINIDSCICTGRAANGIMVHGCWTDNNEPPANFNIINCDIGFSGGHGIHLRGGLTNVNIINSTIHNNGIQEASNGIYAGSASTGFLRNLTIKGCTIFDNQKKGPMNISGQGLNIENNFLYSTVESAIGLTIATDYYVPSMSTRNVMIKNNIIDLQTKYEGAIRVNIPLLNQYSKLNTIRNIKIYNNTVIQRGIYYALYFDTRASNKPDAIDSVEIVNNIIINDKGSKVCIYTDHNTQIPHFIVHHNYYYSALNSSPFVFDGKVVKYQVWKSTYKKDYTQTVFVNPFRGLDKPSNSVISYIPSFCGPLKDKGIHLKDVVFDFFGHSRDSICDIGAIEILSD